MRYLTVNVLKLIRDMLLFSMFLHQAVRKNKTMTKEPSFQNLHEVLNSLLKLFCRIEAKFLVSESTSLVLHSKPVQQDFLYFLKNVKKIMRDLMVNDANLHQDMLFLSKVLHQVLKRSKKKKETVLQEFPTILDPSPTHGFQKMFIFVFLDYFAFITFWKLLIGFLNNDTVLQSSQILVVFIYQFTASE